MRSIIRRVRRSATLLGLGAALAYLLDPDQGAARRERVAAALRGATGGHREVLAPSSTVLPAMPSRPAGADPTGGAAPVQA